MSNNNDKSKNQPMASQQDAMPSIGGGASQAPQVLPGGKVINLSLSVSGQLPVPQNYQHN